MKNDLERIENPEICAKCGGKCCKKYSGAYHPDDFGISITEDSLEQILHNEDKPVSIDWCNLYDGPNGRGYYLRPRHVGGDIVDPSYFGQCMNLTDTGCKFSYEDRPTACREMFPIESGCCITSGMRVGMLDKELNANWWKPYHDILDKLCHKYDKGTHTGVPPISEESLDAMMKRIISKIIDGGVPKVKLERSSSVEDIIFDDNVIIKSIESTQTQDPRNFDCSIKENEDE